MARLKKEVFPVPDKEGKDVVMNVEVVDIPVVPTLPPNLSVDYPSEGLNNMAKTINEILNYLNHASISGK